MYTDKKLIGGYGMAKIWFETVVFYSREREATGEYRAYPVASTSVQTNAKSWAGESGLREEFSNVRFDHVVLTDLEMRGDGGRAYKVLLTHEGKSYEFDFREDVLMDVIRAGGIEGGGRLNGEFEFVRNGSNVRLELVGSAEYLKAKEAYEKSLNPEKKVKSPKIKKSELVPGRVYATDAAYGSHFLYLGERYVDGYTDFTKKKPNKVMLFVEMYDVRRGWVQRCYEQVVSEGSVEVVFKNSVSFTRDMTNVLDLEVVDGSKMLSVMSEFRDRAIADYTEYMEKVLEGEEKPLSYDGNISFNRELSMMGDTLEEFEQSRIAFENQGEVRKKYRKLCERR